MHEHEQEYGKPFILFANEIAQADDVETRKFIRRHVMLGKNRGKTHPNRRKPARKATGKTGEWQDKRPAARNHAKPVSVLPRQVGSDLSSIAWPDCVDVSTMAVIMDFAHHTKKSIHPIDSCIDFPAKDIRWLEPLVTDAAWVHMMAFTSHAYIAVLRGQSAWPVDTRSSPHFARSVRILRERLSPQLQQPQQKQEEERERKGRQVRDTHGYNFNPKYSRGDDNAQSSSSRNSACVVSKTTTNIDDMVLANSTAQVIMSLAAHAIMHGEFAEARCHLLGLRQIVKLRGGFESLTPWPKVIIEILRIDLDLALHTGNAPVFFQDAGTASESKWPHSVHAFPHLNHRGLNNDNISSPFLETCRILEHLPLHGYPDLTQTWVVLQNFCTRVNGAASTKTQLRRDLLVDTMASSMYQLLRLRYYAAGSLAEVVRLSLLTFASGIFLQWHLGFPMGPTCFPGPIQENIRLFDLGGARNMDSGLSFSDESDTRHHQQQQQQRRQHHLLLWILFTAAMVFPQDDSTAWFCARLQTQMVLCGLDTCPWEDVASILHSFPWIDIVHDSHAQRLFDKLRCINHEGFQI